MIGPGKYDDLCGMLREATKADGAVLLVVGGTLGSGFAVQTTDADFQLRLPKLLREMADEVERDNRRTGAHS